MSQFDVFENPIARARRIYPFVAVLQSDLVRTGSDWIVAPLAPRAALPRSIAKLSPRVELAGTDYVVLVLGMTAMRSELLRAHRGQLTPYRGEILAAIDYLFFGL